MNDKLTKFKEHSRFVKKEVRKQTLTYVLAGFGFVAGLAWNEAIKALIEYLFPLNQQHVGVKFLYAVLVTLIVVLVSMYLAKLLRSDDEPAA